MHAFAFATPNLCDDIHDCPIATGGSWLRRWVSAIVSSAEYRSGATVLFVTRPATPFDHYSLPKTTEQLLGLEGRLAHAGDPSTQSMRRAFHL